jgi:hypothetical protein
MEPSRAELCLKDSHHAIYRYDRLSQSLSEDGNKHLAQSLLNISSPTSTSRSLRVIYVDDNTDKFSSVSVFSLAIPTTNLLVSST